MQFNHHYFLILSFFISCIYGADDLTLHNKTPYDLNIALYYLGMNLPDEPQSDAHLASPIMMLKAKTSTTIKNLTRKTKHDRYLVFATDPVLLTDQLTKGQLEKLDAKDVGDMRGNVFYIGYIDNELHAYNPVEWKVSTQAHNKSCPNCGKKKMR